MKNTQLFKVLALLFSLLLLASCEKEELQMDSGTQDYAYGDVVLPGTTKILTPQTMALLQGVSADHSQLRFASVNEELGRVQVGQTLMLGVSEHTPAGLLRKVTGIREGGQVLETEQAYLTEAVKDARIQLKRQITAEDIVSVDLAPGVARGSSGGRTTDDGFTLTLDLGEAELGDDIEAEITGELSVAPALDFDMDIRLFTLRRLKFSVGMEQAAELNLSVMGEVAEVEKKILLATYNLRAIVASGIVILPVVKVYLNFDGELSVGVSTSVTQTSTANIGVDYQNGTWNPIHTFENGFDYSPPQITGELEVETSVGPGVEFLIFGLAGPEVQAVESYFSLVAGPSQEVCWKLVGGLRTALKAEFRAFGRTLSYESPAQLKLEKTIAQATEPCPLLGSIKGQVRDAVTGAGLAGVTVTVYLGGNVVLSAVTDAGGDYTLSVPANQGYRVVYTKAGFIEAGYDGVNVAALATTFLEAILQIDQAYDGNGTIAGRIVNALDGSNLSGVALQLRRGLNTATGQVVAQGVTLSNGTYLFADIPAGNYTIEASKSGFNTAYISVLSLGGQTVGNQNGSLTPTLNEGEIRIILTWGASPSDLDSHLTGPRSDGNGRFHVYWRNREPANSNANLDLDDVTSYGPETVTILQQQPTGVYRYSVYDYTNGGRNSSEMARSGAKVRVIKGATDLGTFNVPNQPGTLWTVFEIEGNDFRLVNNMSFEDDSDDVQRQSASDANLIKDLPIKQ